MAATRPFLTAQWRYLAMLNYHVAPAMLRPFVPPGTELDLWRGRTVISLVGFRFLGTRLQGCAIPGHRDFSEVNLRFYVRRQAEEGWRRGVVFLKEIVPRHAVSWVANTIYHENYVTLPMSHRIQIPASAADRTGYVRYGWRYRGRPFEMSAEFQGLPQPLVPDSEAQFIAEHYWGYTKRRDGTTSEYQVTHPAWRVWHVDHAAFTGDASALYGPEFAAVLRDAPDSALVADGSPVMVYRGAQVAERVGELNRPERAAHAVSGAY